MLGALVVALTMAVILLVWTRPHDAAAGDDDSRTDPSSKPKKKKAAREKATGEHASAKPTSASSERRSPSAEVTAKDFLAGAAGEVPLAIKKQFGADARLVELVLMPGVIAPSLASPGRADTLVHYNGRATFEGDIVFDKGSEIPTSPNLASTVFTLDTIDFGKIPGMVKDARARVGEKKNSLTIVLCMRGAPEPGFTTLGPVRCSVLIEAEHGKENLEYETDGKFRQTLGR